MRANAMKPMTVGQVARQAGVGVETVRFYEKTGRLEEPARRASGYRAYDEETVNRLRFIQRAKELGFTLSEIKELLSLRSCADQPCDDVRSRAEAKIAEIENKVAMLLRMKEVLGRLISSCGEPHDSSCCPILEVLEGRDIEESRRIANDDDNNRHLSAQPDQREAGQHDDAARARPRRVSQPDRGQR
jgi:MerR family mercuric resistance operon transcriptional regulator